MLRNWERQNYFQDFDFIFVDLQKNRDKIESRTINTLKQSKQVFLDIPFNVITQNTYESLIKFVYELSSSNLWIESDSFVLL